MKKIKSAFKISVSAIALSFVLGGDLYAATRASQTYSGIPVTDLNLNRNNDVKRLTDEKADLQKQNNEIEQKKQQAEQKQQQAEKEKQQAEQKQQQAEKDKQQAELEKQQAEQKLISKKQRLKTKIQQLELQLQQSLGHGGAGGPGSVSNGGSSSSSGGSSSSNDPIVAKLEHEIKDLKSQIASLTHQLTGQVDLSDPVQKGMAELKEKIEQGAEINPDEIEKLVKEINGSKNQKLAEDLMRDSETLISKEQDPDKKAALEKVYFDMLNEQIFEEVSTKIGIEKSKEEVKSVIQDSAGEYQNYITAPYKADDIKNPVEFMLHMDPEQLKSISKQDIRKLISFFRKTGINTLKSLAYFLNVEGKINPEPSDANKGKDDINGFYLALITFIQKNPQNAEKNPTDESLLKSLMRNKKIDWAAEQQNIVGQYASEKSRVTNDPNFEKHKNQTYLLLKLMDGNGQNFSKIDPPKKSKLEELIRYTPTDILKTLLSFFSENKFFSEKTGSAQFQSLIKTIYRENNDRTGSFRPDEFTKSLAVTYNKVFDDIGIVAAGDDAEQPQAASKIPLGTIAADMEGIIKDKNPDMTSARKRNALIKLVEKCVSLKDEGGGLNDIGKKIGIKITGVLNGDPTLFDFLNTDIYRTLLETPSNVADKSKCVGPSGAVQGGSKPKNDSQKPITVNGREIVEKDIVYAIIKTKKEAIVNDSIKARAIKASVLKNKDLKTAATDEGFTASEADQIENILTSERLFTTMSTDYGTISKKLYPGVKISVIERAINNSAITGTIKKSTKDADIPLVGMADLLSKAILEKEPGKKDSMDMAVQTILNLKFVPENDDGKIIKRIEKIIQDMKLGQTFVQATSDISSSSSSSSSAPPPPPPPPPSSSSAPPPPPMPTNGS